MKNAAVAVIVMRKIMYLEYWKCERCWDTRLEGKNVHWFSSHKLSQEHLNEGYSVKIRSKDGNGNTITEDLVIEKVVFSTHVTTVASANKIYKDKKLLKNNLSLKKYKGIFFNTTTKDPTQPTDRRTKKPTATLLEGMRNFMENNHDVKEDDDIVMVVLENNEHEDFKEALKA